METFLRLVAEDLLNRYGCDLSKVAVVFPNKRAGLFFNQALAHLSETPVWTPAYMSISDLFCRLSALRLGDNIQLVCELYKVFLAETGRDESLDDFYFWGEMLIADFDDIDKNRVDADRLFSNLSDWKDMTVGTDFLDEEQEEAIRQFFRNFSIEKHTELKERFLSLWSVLGTVYHHFKDRLRQQGMAYEGMLYRDASDKFDPHNLPFDTYVFVGFNVLNKVEQQLFCTLRDAGKALFYWDYDEFYMNENHEAGEFIRRNMLEFPQAFSEYKFDTFSKPKHVTIIGAPTENAQARYLTEWMSEAMKDGSVAEQDCAVVLCNEALLQPVLNSIPPSVSNVNITMGFPMAQTPVYSFVSLLLNVQEDYKKETGRFACSSVVSLLRHPYICMLSVKSGELRNNLMKKNRFYPQPNELQADSVLAELFVPLNGNLALCDYLLRAMEKVALFYRENKSEDALEQLNREAVFKCYTVIARFRTLIEEGGLMVSQTTFRCLLDRVLSSNSIPFHGEPAIGLQVMGVLETRNLDFRHLVILSLNEGLLPKKEGENSFIPYNLRKAFGMTTVEHKNAVYAYYFYRLLQRAENVTLLYNTSMDGLNKGERSRFLLQYLIESPHGYALKYLDAGQKLVSVPVISIVKTPEIRRRMVRMFTHDKAGKKARLTPSALNCYLDCKLRFYYKYVANLKSADEVSAEIDSALFGSIFHRSAEMVYEDLIAHGKLIRKEDLTDLLNNETRLQEYVDNAFKELFFHVDADEKTEYNGVQLIHASVIVSYLRRLLQRDLAYAPFTMEATEYPTYLELDVCVGEDMLHTSIGGIIDRMDSKDGTLRIVDYKTGGSPKGCSEIEDLFVPSEKRANYIFQAFTYAYVMLHQLSSLSLSSGLCRISPVLLYIHQSDSPTIEIGTSKEKKVVDDFSVYASEFKNYLDKLLAELFSLDVPFEQTSITDNCNYCDFKELCGKK